MFTLLVKDSRAFIKRLARGKKETFSFYCTTGYFPPLSRALFLKSTSLDVILEAAKILVLVSES